MQQFELSGRLLNMVSTFGSRSGNASSDGSLNFHSSLTAAASKYQPDEIAINLFDVVVGRRLASQGAVNRVVADRLVERGIWSGPAGELVSARNDVEAAAPKGRLVDWLKSDKLPFLKDVKTALEVEEDVERWNLYALPRSVALINELRRIAPLHLLADTHLSGPFLRSVLTELGVLTSGDKLTVSSEVGLSAASGELAADIWGLDVKRGMRVVQISAGQAIRSKAAREIVNLTVPETELTPMEEVFAGGPSPVGAVIAGAARSARCELLTAGASPASAFGADLGQLLVSFVLWVRNEIERQGISHVVFLARDGELPLRVARALDASYWADHVELSYLHCNRHAWGLAGASSMGIQQWIELGSSDEHAFLRHSATSVPFADVLARCGLVHRDIPHDSTLRQVALESSLSRQQAEMWTDLLQSGRLNNVISERADDRRSLIADHLLQSGFPTGRVALVDVGWRGQQARLADSLIGEHTRERPLHLHFGGDGVSAEVDDDLDIRRFALDDSRWSHPIDNPVGCLEMILGTGVGALVGYERRDDGTVREVFGTASPVKTDAQQRWADAAVQTARAMPSVGDLHAMNIRVDGDLVDVVRESLADFWNSPTPETARWASQLRFEIDGSGQRFGEVARSYRLRDWLLPVKPHRQWRSASLALSSPWMRAMARWGTSIRG